MLHHAHSHLFKTMKRGFEEPDVWPSAQWLTAIIMLDYSVPLAPFTDQQGKLE